MKCLSIHISRQKQTPVVSASSHQAAAAAICNRGRYGPGIATVAWPSGLRRWFKAPVSSEAWVRIPPLPAIFFFFFFQIFDPLDLYVTFLHFVFWLNSLKCEVFSVCFEAVRLLCLETPYETGDISSLGKACSTPLWKFCYCKTCNRPLKTLPIQKHTIMETFLFRSS